MNRITHPLRWLYGLTLLLIGISFFWGYCWNWWAQSNLWQFLFQDYCPASSEEARYPANIDVLVSARAKPHIGLPTSGNRWMVYTRRSDDETQASRRYLYDFQSGMTVVADLPEREEDRYGSFITDEWVLLFKERDDDDSELTATDDYLLNWKTQQRIPLTTYQIQGGVRNLAGELLTLLRNSHSVYVSGAVMLAVPTSLEEGSFTSGYLIRHDQSIGLGDESLTAEMLGQLGVTAIPIGGNVSIDKEFYWSAEIQSSIFSNRTRQSTAVSDMPLPLIQPSGWAYRDQGIILSPAFLDVLISNPLNMSALPMGWFPVHEPILLLRQDAQYLPPDIQAEFVARDAEEARNRQGAGVVLGALLAGTGAMGAFTVRAHWRRARRETEVQYAGA